MQFQYTKFAVRVELKLLKLSESVLWSCEFIFAASLEQKTVMQYPGSYTKLFLFRSLLH